MWLPDKLCGVQPLPRLGGVQLHPGMRSDYHEQKSRTPEDQLVEVSGSINGLRITGQS